jgi:hypothetical protein
LACDLRKLSCILTKTEVDDKALPFDVAPFTKPLAERLEPRRGRMPDPQKADAMYSPRLLRPDAERRGEHSPEASDERAAAHHRGDLLAGGLAGW